MAEYITLLGAEQVSNAASTMKSAAHDMAQVVSNFESVLFRTGNGWKIGLYALSRS